VCIESCHPGHKCTNIKGMKSSVIHVDDVDEPGMDHDRLESPSPWVKIAGVSLNEDHKRMLETSEWLDDEVITAAQHLLKDQYPAVGSLQTPTLASKLALEPQTSEFVQILNLNNNHWITVSTVGCQPGHINVYDSLHMTLSEHIKKVLADLLRRQDRTITINHCNVQWQSGSSDCGLFAIAFATAICSGHDPATRVFDQSQMRQHMITCFNNRKITAFPERSMKRVVKKSKQEVIEVYCVCRLPDDGSVMIQCSRCEEWYHPSCVRVPRKFLKKECKEQYICKFC